MICCGLMACKKNNVDFTYSPSAPRAGESVQFTNHSDSGEEWEWTFGDGAVSTLKSPSHIYKRPGQYDVLLKVDKKNAWTKAARITVFDTIPTFVANDSVFYVYKNYTFTANVYNPYNYDVNLEWDIEEQDTLVQFTTNGIVCYFTQPDDSALIKLHVILNGDTTFVQKKFYIDPTATDMLDEEQDTIQTYSGYTFRLSELKETFPALRGFHIASRKIYYRADDGLWVANIDGANPVQIDGEDCFAMTLDTKDSRIYWANAFGVWYMPFVGSDNNKFITTPVRLNDLDDVMKLKADPNLK